MDDRSTVAISSEIPLAALELTLKSLDRKPVTITSAIPGFEPFYSQEGEIVTLGLFDLTGSTQIPSGNSAILEIDGNVEIVSVLGADENANGLDFEIVNAASKESQLPGQYILSQNHPNPFNPTTQISFSLPEVSDVILDIYNITGQKVAALVNGTLEAGEHSIEWDSRDQSGRPVASGIYLYRITAGDFTDTKKMILMK